MQAVCLCHQTNQSKQNAGVAANPALHPPGMWQIPYPDHGHDLGHLGGHGHRRHELPLGVSTGCQFFEIKLATDGGWRIRDKALQLGENRDRV